MSNGVTPNGSSDQTHTASQRYLSTRGEDSGVRTPPSSCPFVLDTLRNQARREKTPLTV
jgi:hypothetical protein